MCFVERCSGHCRPLSVLLQVGDAVNVGAAEAHAEGREREELHAVGEGIGREVALSAETQDARNEFVQHVSADLF